MLSYVTTNPGKVREAEEYLGDGVGQLRFDYTEVQSDDLGPVAARGAREAYRHAVRVAEGELPAGDPGSGDGPAADPGDGGSTAGDGPARPRAVADDPADVAVLVDDAGLFVEAFDGFPGPYSAYVENTLGVERVWELTAGEDDRRAAFRCVLAYCDGGGFEAGPDTLAGEPDGPATAADPGGADLPVKLFEGVVRGRLVAPRGEGGFGYDPVFEHRERTFAELSPAEKNAVSHRGRALEAFAEWYADR